MRVWKEKIDTTLEKVTWYKRNIDKIPDITGYNGYMYQVTPDGYLQYTKIKYGKMDDFFEQFDGLNDQIQAEFFDYSDFNNLKNEQVIFIE